MYKKYNSVKTIKLRSSIVQSGNQVLADLESFSNGVVSSAIYHSPKKRLYNGIFPRKTVYNIYRRIEEGHTIDTAFRQIAQTSVRQQSDLIYTRCT